MFECMTRKQFFIEEDSLAIRQPDSEFVENDAIGKVDSFPERLGSFSQLYFAPMSPPPCQARLGQLQTRHGDHYQEGAEPCAALRIKSLETDGSIAVQADPDILNDGRRLDPGRLVSPNYMKKKALVSSHQFGPGRLRAGQAVPDQGFFPGTLVQGKSRVRGCRLSARQHSGEPQGDDLSAQTEITAARTDKRLC